jgi:hypothetical protein
VSGLRFSALVLDKGIREGCISFTPPWPEAGYRAPRADLGDRVPENAPIGFASCIFGNQHISA